MSETKPTERLEQAMRLPIDAIDITVPNVRQIPAPPAADLALQASLKALGMLEPVLVRELHFLGIERCRRHTEHCSSDCDRELRHGDRLQRRMARRHAGLEPNARWPVQSGVAAPGAAAGLDDLHQRAQPRIDVASPLLGLRRAEAVADGVVVIARRDLHDEPRPARVRVPALGLRRDDREVGLGLRIVPERQGLLHLNAPRLAQAARELGRQMRIPGFRKGKVPPPVVMRRLNSGRSRSSLP